MKFIKNIKYLLAMVFMASTLFPLIGQDLHFSQFYSSPLTLNPANTGVMRQDIRLAAIRREQWGNLASTFLTNAISADVAFQGGFLGQDKIGVGIVFYDDNMGEGLLKSQNFLLSTAYHRTLDAHQLHDLSIGAQVGYMQKRLNNDNFRFENQFQDWEFQESLVSGENFDNANQNNISLHIGALWQYTIPPQKLKYHLGVSVFQVNSPTEEFLSESNNELNTRFTIHTGIDYRITPKITLSPKLLFMNQSNARDINLGGMIAYQFAEDFVLLGGIWTRLQDANIAMIGTRLFKNYEIKFSYDATKSSMKNLQGVKNTANTGRVASWEISLIVVGNIFKSVPRNYTVPCGIF